MICIKGIDITIDGIIRTHIVYIVSKKGDVNYLIPYNKNEIYFKEYKNVIPALTPEICCLVKTLFTNNCPDGLRLPLHSLQLFSSSDKLKYFVSKLAEKYKGHFSGLNSSWENAISDLSNEPNNYNFYTPVEIRDSFIFFFKSATVLEESLLSSYLATKSYTHFSSLLESTFSLIQELFKAREILEFKLLEDSLFEDEEILLTTILTFLDKTCVSIEQLNEELEGIYVIIEDVLS